MNDNQKHYQAMQPIADKFVKIDGSMVSSDGTVLSGPNAEWAEWYAAQTPTASKFLLPDGTITETLPTSGGGLPPAEKDYLEKLINVDAINRFLWQDTLAMIQTGAITTEWVYLEILTNPLTTDSNWKITHSGIATLERAGKRITYTDGNGEVVLSDNNGNVLESKFHIPSGLTVEEITGDPLDDIDNVRIIVEFDTHSLREIIGDTDALTTDSKILVGAVNELLSKLTKVDVNDKLLSFSDVDGWKAGLTNDTHGGHIRLLDKAGDPFLDIDVAAYGSGLEAVFPITFIGGEFDPTKSYSTGDRAHHRETVTLTNWPQITECTLAYTAAKNIDPGDWNPSQWDLRNDEIANQQINTFTEIARDGFIFVATHQMTWDHEPTIDEFTPDDWYLIGRLPVNPGIFAIFMLDNDEGKVGWLAADELAPFKGTSSINIDPQGNVALVLNTGGLLQMTDNGLMLKWNTPSTGVLSLGTDTSKTLYTKAQVDTLLAAKANSSGTAGTQNFRLATSKNTTVTLGTVSSLSYSATNSIKFEIIGGSEYEVYSVKFWVKGTTTSSTPTIVLKEASNADKLDVLLSGSSLQLKFGNVDYTRGAAVTVQCCGGNFVRA
jgi:hypothetical protein